MEVSMHKSAYKINIILSTKILRNFRIVKSMAQKAVVHYRMPQIGSSHNLLLPSGFFL